MANINNSVNTAIFDKLLSWDEYYRLAVQNGYSFRKLADEGVLTFDTFAKLNTYYKKKKKEVEVWKLRTLTLDAMFRGWV